MTMKDILHIQYKKHILPNGLEVILHKDNSLPLTAVNLWYKVGSANEVEGKTGFAHLFEHMMFQGSQNVPKEMHFKYIQEAGGSLNGSTSIDRTNYYETVPSNFLEMALWLESDRMGFLLPALTQEKLTNQKDVVMNERRQSYENRPYGLAWELIFSNLYTENYPYHWPTIGWMRDIEKYELDDVKNFFKKYYAPNNASIIIAGDIKYDSTFKLVEKYFGEIPAGEPVKKITTEKQELDETKKVIHEDNVELPRIHLVWNSENLYGKDDAALDVLADILFGSKNSRLIKSLVIEKQTAHEVSGFQYSAHLNGSFLIITTARPGIELSEIKKDIFLEINKLLDEGITNEELTRSKNSNKSSFIYSLQNLSTKADLMNNYNTYLNEPNSFYYDYERINNLKAEDVVNAAKKYLTKNYVELNIIPTAKRSILKGK